MKNKELKNNLHFVGETEGVIFNHNSFCEMIKHIMVKYGEITYERANEKLKNSFLIEEPESKDDVEFLGHELEFHWAMLALHGDMYWIKGIPSDYNNFKKEYLAWETAIKLKYKLKELYIYYEIKK